jgi:hypothetical protein
MGEPLRLSITVRSERLSADKITEIIGLEPTKSRAKRARNPPHASGFTISNANSWHLEAHLETDWDVNGLVVELEPALLRLAELKGRFYSVELWFMGHGRLAGAWITLTAESVQLIANAGLEIHLDMYCSEECCEDD